jgi:hypothetical protein
MKRLLCSLLLAIPVAACGHLGGNDAAAVVDRTATWDSFGAPVVADAESVTLAQLVAEPSQYDGKRVLVHGGKVDAVCKKKGCWMMLGSGDDQIRVTFKDYGFFVPLDCESREVVMLGTFEVKIVPLDEAKHYLEDAGKHDEAAKLTEDQKELRLVADGVRLAK